MRSTAKFLRDTEIWRKLTESSLGELPYTKDSMGKKHKASVSVELSKWTDKA